MTTPVLDWTRQPLTAVRAALQRGEVTSVALTEAMLARIYAYDNVIKSYLTVTADHALGQAAAADARLAQGDRTPLLGVPIALKDMLCTRGITTTAGSRVLENFVPPYDAHVVTCLAEAGAVLLGKTNTDEFAMGSTTESSAFCTTVNPWDHRRVPGGSSGGSAAAVAAGLAYGALGTDTGGSVRQPAAFCNLVGLRPTYGRVSRWGAVAYASSLDQIGPLALTVRDCAALLQVIAGHDRRDSTSLDAPVPDYEAALIGDIRGLRVGVPREYFAAGLADDVAAAVRTAIDQLAALGAEPVEISLPHTPYTLPAYYLIATAEASANLARYDGIRYGTAAPGADMVDAVRQSRARFGAETKRRIMLGTYALSAGYYDAYYGRALKARTLVKNDFVAAFEKVHVIAAPTSPTTAVPLGALLEDPLQMYLADVLTLPLNLSPSCGLSLPCGFDAQNLPIGLQLIGNTLEEAQLLNVAYAYEQATLWHTRRATDPQPEA